MESKTPSEGTRKLVAIAKKVKREQIALDLNCTTTTVDNLLHGGRPSLLVALAAERAYKIPPRLWEVVA